MSGGACAGHAHLFESEQGVKADLSVSLDSSQLTVPNRNQSSFRCETLNETVCAWRHTGHTAVWWHLSARASDARGGFNAPLDEM